MTEARSTDGLIEDWQQAQQRLAKAKSELSSAEVAVHNSVNALAKRLVPRDAKPGELFNVWHCGVLYQVGVSKDGMSNYLVTIRSRDTA